MFLTYDRTWGVTQESSIQHPQGGYSVGGKTVKWGAQPHVAKARYSASNILSASKQHSLEFFLAVYDYRPRRFECPLREEFVVVFPGD